MLHTLSVEDRSNVMQHCVVEPGDWLYVSYMLSAVYIHASD